MTNEEQKNQTDQVEEPVAEQPDEQVTRAKAEEGRPMPLGEKLGVFFLTLSAVGLIWLQPDRLAPDAQAFRQLGVDEHYRGGRGRLAGFLRVHGRPPWLGWAAAS